MPMPLTVKILAVADSFEVMTAVRSYKSAMSLADARAEAKQVLAAANQGKNGMEQTERIERGGHAEPDDAHFSHGRIGNRKS